MARTYPREYLALAGNCHSIYARRLGFTRRMANQAFCKGSYVDTEDQITSEPTRSYRFLRSPAVLRRALSGASLRQDSKKRPT